MQTGGIVAVGNELINVAKLFIREFTPLGGNGEVDVECLHKKSVDYSAKLQPTDCAVKDVIKELKSFSQFLQH